MQTQRWSSFSPCVFHTKGIEPAAVQQVDNFILCPACHDSVTLTVTAKDIISIGVSVFRNFHEWRPCEFR